MGLAIQFVVVDRMLWSAGGGCHGLSPEHVGGWQLASHGGGWSTARPPEPPLILIAIFPVLDAGVAARSIQGQVVLVSLLTSPF